MKTTLRRFTIGMPLFLFLSAMALPIRAQPEFRRLPVQEFRDKMKAGWIGQIIGVSWGAPTEGKYDKIMPAQDLPPLRESLINDAFGQDDLYVEMTFLRTLEQHGYEVPITISPPCWTCPKNQPARPRCVQAVASRKMRTAPGCFSSPSSPSNPAVLKT
jgi:hypothetical protein